MISAADIYNKFVRKLLKKTFCIWQALGIHVVPNHYYEPIPDTATLGTRLWDNVSSLPGINMRDEEQSKLIQVFSKAYGNEYAAFPKNKTSIKHEYYISNNSFMSVDAEILYCMIRHFKPKRIIEIGSGYSTFLSAQALLRNAKENGFSAEFVAIEPYPNETLKAGFPGLSSLKINKIQDIDISYFQQLDENDILFIDSSHVLKTGSDVYYEYLEILPSLKKGVIVHIHDIFLPSEYPQHWIMKDRKFWTEQYLLQAFLSGNESFEVLWGGSYMHLKHSDLLQRHFTSYTPKSWPGSFWIRKIK